VAGFSEADIDIEYAENKLTVKGNNNATEPAYIHRGIANRDFTRTFALNEDVEVKGAELKNGLLTIALERIIPEHKKPKKISIGELPSTSTGLDRVRELLVEKDKLKEQA
jgi:molecular chaperone IbpA